MITQRFLYSLTLIGFFGTFILLVAWYSWLAPSTHFPVSLVLLVVGLPLFTPMRGILHERRYTISWSCFLAMLYFIHGVVEAWHSDVTRYLGLAEILFTTLWFMSAMFYVKFSGKRD